MQEYYHTRDWENLNSHYAENMSFFKQNKLWKEYYKIFELYAELLRLQENSNIAIDEATKMFAFAKKTNNYYGLGYVSKVLGHFYNLDDDAVQSENYLRDAVNYFDKAGDKSSEFSVYNDLVWTLQKQKKYSELANFLAQMEKSLKEFEKQNGVSYHWRFGLYHNYSEYYFATEDLAKVGLYVQKMGEILSHLSNAYTPFYLKQRFYLLEKLGRYKEEIAVIDTLETMLAADDFYMRQFVMKQKIYALGKSGRGNEAANLFIRYCNIKDSLNLADTKLQLNELRTKYDINKLEMQKEHNRNNFLFALGGMALLMVVAVVILINRQKIRRKNILLVSQIKELQELQQIKEDELLQKSTFETELQTDTALCPDTRKDKLCLTLRDMMIKDRLYRDPNITRDSMIAHLGTNKAFFIESFQYCFGTTFTAYINYLRLKEAINLLENSDLSLDEIADKVGFGTLRTFQRQFRAEYGMAISDFRKLAK
ncbi:hypothetical protein FACS189437_04160 [Bacteroidia bacterium]|nr:hypothetical protein FACS189437_04160 [Bacteroidia bacterium]